ncbi:pyridoxamine 5'-phosphate oxidase family protein [Streptomyces auratus]|uniref:pyridoxamine 5'-phosphate oxidase family protein n=1 Tax=Streptomyces TaxID=1883 RepID=UPI003D2417DF
MTGRCWLQSCSWPRQAARGSSSRQRRSGRDRHRLHAGGLGRPRGVPPQHRTDRAEALRLLGSVLLGRIVFTQDALPAICPVNHLLHHGEVIIRTHEGAALTSLTERAPDEGVVVAYEADAIAPATYCGWSVVVTGYCHLVTDPDELAHYQALLHPWADHRMSYALRIRPDLVTGVRPSP